MQKTKTILCSHLPSYLKNLIPGPFSGLPLPKIPKQEFRQGILSAAVTSKS